MNDLVQCSWCGRILIAEQFESHDCDIPCKSSKEISVSSIFDCTTKTGERKVGVGTDGIYYWLIVRPKVALPWPSDERKQRDDPTERHQSLNEEALLFAKYLRAERETWNPRIGYLA